MKEALLLGAGCRNLAKFGLEQPLKSALTDLVNSCKNIFVESYLAGVKSVARVTN